MNNPSVWRPLASSTDGVPNLAYLSGVEIPVPEDGIVIFVVDTGTGPGSGFDHQLSLTSGATVDGYNVVSTFLGGLSRWLRVGGVTGSVGSSFIYREGGVAEGAVFAHWQDAYNAAIACKVDCFIGIDDSIAPCHVPAGTYAMDRITIGAAEVLDFPSPTFLNFDDGAHCTGLDRVSQTLILRANGLSPVVTISPGVPGSAEIMAIGEGSRIVVSAGAAPFVRVLSGAALIITCLIGATISTEAPGVSRAIQIDAGGFLEFQLDSASRVESDVFIGNGTVRFNVLSNSTEFSVAQPALTTSVIVNLACKAVLDLYTPAVLADWSGVAPTSVADALDRIAAKITPIP